MAEKKKKNSTRWKPKRNYLTHMTHSDRIFFIINSWHSLLMSGLKTTVAETNSKGTHRL